MNRSIVRLAVVLAIGALGCTSAPVSPPATTPVASMPPATPSVAPRQTHWQASEFRWPFRFTLPSDTRFEYGPDFGPTYFEIRMPAAAEAGTPAGLIVQAVGAGRTNPCAAGSLPLPIDVSPPSMIEYLRGVPGLTVSPDGQTRVHIGNADYGDDPLFGEQMRVKAQATPGCPELYPWAEGGPEPLPAGTPLRMITLQVGGEHVVVTVYGEADNPWWATMAGELVDSIRFSRIRSQPRESRTPHPWTGIIRVEPGGEPLIVKGTRPTPSENLQIIDGADGAIDGSLGLVDIVNVDPRAPCGLAACARIHVAHEIGQAPRGEPRRLLVAYGLVIDRQGDGIPDLQVGVDNANGHRRTWRTDLHSAETASGNGWSVADTSVRAWVPGLYSGGFPRIPIRPGPEETRRDAWVGVSHWLRIVEKLADPALNFYVFAAAIRDGKIVAVDYAPDVGWLTAAPARS
jgi:hypothetical protein